MGLGRGADRVLARVVARLTGLITCSWVAPTFAPGNGSCHRVAALGEISLAAGPMPVVERVGQAVAGLSGGLGDPLMAAEPMPCQRPGHPPRPFSVRIDSHMFADARDT